MTETLIDPEAWDMMKSMTDAAFLAELVDTYLSDSPELIEHMRAGLAVGDIPGVQRAAHSLKSNSASLGATRLANAARELEMVAKGGSLEGGAAKLAVVEVEYAKVQPVLVELKNEPR
jgi:HPt (histidine-containing phosphotransfer) domain-containing protein